MPANAAYPFLHWPGPLAFAHRGGASEAPENTMPAFEHAVRLGYRYLETDAHVTADGVLIAFHDDRLDRVTDRTGVIAELPWSEVQRARVDGREPIPLLEDLLAAWPDVRVNIDPKQDARRRAAGRRHPPHRQRRPRVRRRVQRSSHRGREGARRSRRCARRWARARSPSWWPRRAGCPAAVGSARRARRCRPTRAACALVTPRFVDTAHRLGVQVHVWTIDDRAEMARLLDLGVDGIMTDRPQVLKDLLGRAWRLDRPLVELPLTPLDLLARARRLFADRVGVIDGDERWTYARARRPVRPAGPRAAARPRTCGRARSSPGWAGTPTSCWRRTTGCCSPAACCSRSTSGWRRPSCAAILDASGAVVLFRHPDQPDPGHPVRTIVLGDEHEALLAAQPDGPVATPPVDEHAAAELFYTSGSTGTPKGALLSHRGLYLHAIHSALTMGLTGDDVFLHTIPLFHVNGWGTPHFVTGLGGVHVMLPRFDAGEVLRLVEAHRVTRLFLVPAMARLVLDHPDAATPRPVERACRSRSAARRPAPRCSPSSRTPFGCEAICGYGMTESSPTLTRSLPMPGAPSTRAQRATTGRPILGVDVRVLDADDVEVPWDGQTIGEICARSNHVMIGYLDAPEATDEVLRGGWLRTGDLAVVDADGYLTIVDRAKDLIVSGGENIASVEVEQALELHPAVREAAVVGVPDDRWGEVPRAFVSLVARRVGDRGRAHRVGARAAWPPSRRRGPS